MIPDSVLNQLHGGTGSPNTLNAYYSKTTPSRPWRVVVGLSREEGLIVEHVANIGRDMGTVGKPGKML